MVTGVLDLPGSRVHLELEKNKAVLLRHFTTIYYKQGSGVIAICSDRWSCRANIVAGQGSLKWCQEVSSGQPSSPPSSAATLNNTIRYLACVIS